MTDTTPVVAAAYRTPQGKEDGVFADVRSEDLSIPLVNEILAETRLESDAVDDLMWGCAQQRGEQGNNVARVIALLSDLGESVPATTINRWCASSAQAIISASDAIRAGQRDCIIAGGVENMSRVKMGENMGSLHPRLAEEYNVPELSMGMTAEKVAEEFDIAAIEEEGLPVALSPELLEGSDEEYELEGEPEEFSGDPQLIASASPSSDVEESEQPAESEEETEKTAAAVEAEAPEEAQEAEAEQAEEADEEQEPSGVTAKE